jgi:predicted dithiol-disulfide oxidoreductase (DUF899 family)
VEKIAKFKERMGWQFPWYSSFNSDFNYDFHVTLDESVCPVEYNFIDKAELERKGQPHLTQGEMPGLSVFTREGNDIYHTYSAYSRGVDFMMTTYALLDLTPLGRQDGDKGPRFLYHDQYEK